MDRERQLEFFGGREMTTAELRKELLKSSTSKNGLIGKFFHSFTDDGAFKWQGYVVDEPQPGTYLVQLFDWMMGYPSRQELVPFSQMKDWNFYKSSETWAEYYEQHGDRLYEKSLTAEQGKDFSCV